MPIRIGTVAPRIATAHTQAMSKHEIGRIIEAHAGEAAMADTGVKGLRLFRVTEPVRCAPAVYEPTVVAVVSGSKEAILDGRRYVYDSDRYMCCPISMPVEAGTPHASPDDPLLGVQIMLDTKAMRELAITMEHAPGAVRPSGEAAAQGLALARWDGAFTDALLRLLRLLDSPADAAVLGDARLRELHYAVLKGDAGPAARRAFGAGNEIARAVEHVAARLHEPVTIDDMAARVGMSRAVFHRKFKRATTLSPIQFVKAMRLNNAAMRIADGTRVSDAAMDVGYVSSSQFSREFKRMYGLSPRQWSQAAPSASVP